MIEEIQADTRNSARGRVRRLPIVVMALVAGAGLALALLLARAPSASLAPAPAALGGASVTIKLNGVVGSKGVVMAALCDRATFLKRCPYMQSVAAAPSLTLRFDGVKPGVYAAMLFHDENNNGQFDRSPNGMPLEGYGFSRNAQGHYGPPAFDDAAFEVKAAEASVDIDMTY